MQGSKIEWTQNTYNPIIVKGGGFYCFKVSPACTNCYAENMARRIAAMLHTTEQPYTNRLIFPEMELKRDMLASWAKKGKTKLNFVSSMTDVFGEFVPDEYVFEILDAMLNAPRQIFQVLTKREERAYNLIKTWLESKKLKKLPPNIWIGFSIENQQWANTRLPWLVKIPAHVRFISCEPMIGLINIRRWTKKLHWVICGGESGIKKTIRPLVSDCAIDLRNQCAKAAIPFFFKQWGEWIEFAQMPVELQRALKAGETKHKIRNFKYLDIIYTFHRVGKHNTGALLDGKEHKEFPPLNI